MDNLNTLTRFDLFRVFLRLLFMQGLLNRRGMQNLALANALAPVAGKIDAGRVKSLQSRHLDFFNCNPNFVPVIVGGLLRLEVERLAGKPVSDNDIQYFKKSLAGPLAAAGDMLFIGSAKPLALTCACIFAIYKFPIGLLAVFLLYNLTIISCRLWGIYFGYAKGWELVDFFTGPVFQRLLGVVHGIGAAVAGIFVGVVFDRVPQTGPWVLVMGAVLLGTTLFALRRNVPASWLAIILFPISVLLSLLVGRW
ncbi:MAG: PTS system mannose/fructose/sorbose family transporter subunit IID [bacterium]|nr:PTS system mannose/fructose/sorbose family transporter subunit IID [bacterium]